MDEPTELDDIATICQRATVNLDPEDKRIAVRCLQIATHHFEHTDDDGEVIEELDLCGYHAAEAAQIHGLTYP